MDKQEIPKAQTFCLTFDEIAKLSNEAQKFINSGDYGFAPVMIIKIDKDPEWEEKEYISTTCLHEITKACIDEKEKQDIPWVDITDESKFDCI